MGIAEKHGEKIESHIANFKRLEKDLVTAKTKFVPRTATST